MKETRSKKQRRSKCSAKSPWWIVGLTSLCIDQVVLVPSRVAFSAIVVEVRKLSCSAPLFGGVVDLLLKVVNRRVVDVAVCAFQ